MSAYGRGYDELIHMAYSRFEDLWKAYSTRTALDKLDEEVARQRSVIQGAMAESKDIEAALVDLTERYEQSKRYILHPELLMEEQQSEVAQTPWGEFRTDKWWEDAPAQPDAAAEETPVPHPPPEQQRRTEADLGLGLGGNMDLTDLIDWEE